MATEVDEYIDLLMEVSYVEVKYDDLVSLPWRFWLEEVLVTLYHIMIVGRKYEFCRKHFILYYICQMTFIFLFVIFFLWVPAGIICKRTILNIFEQEEEKEITIPILQKSKTKDMLLTLARLRGNE